jgi:hypothetical protein
LALGLHLALPERTQPVPRSPLKTAIRIGFAIALAISISACKGRKKDDGGVVDGGGGGDVIYNSREDALTAVDQAWRLMISHTPANPIFHAYQQLRKKHIKERLSKDDEAIYVLLVKMLSGPEKIPSAPSNSVDFNLTNLNYLSEKKLRLLEDDLCSGPGDHKFMASVTKLDRSGEICVSIKALMRLPSGNLKPDLIALFAHEIAHLNGADEPAARQIQKFFISSISQLLRQSTDELKAEKLATFRDNILLQWLGLIPENYDRFVKAHRQTAFDISHGLARLEVPDPYVGQELHIARPELFLTVKKKAAKLSSYYYALAVGTLIDNQPINDKELRKLRRLGLELVDVANDWNLYLIGKPLAPWYREKILAATDPRTIHDSSARPNLSGTDCPDCRGVGVRMRDTSVTDEESAEINRQFQERLRQRLQPYIDELDRE